MRDSINSIVRCVVSMKRVFSHPLTALAIGLCLRLFFVLQFPQTSGDTVLYDGRLGWQGNPYADNRAYLASLEKLNAFTLDMKKVRWDVLLPGHGAIAMYKAYLDVQKDLEFVAQLLQAGREIPAVPFADPSYRGKMFGRPAVAPAN